MINLNIFLSYTALILTSALLFVCGYFAVFKTKRLMAYYLYNAKKNYLRSQRTGFFSNRFSRFLSKDNYERQKRNYKNNRSYYTYKLTGTFMLLMAVFILFVITHRIFEITFGIFKN
jgi:hypothetical protein